MIKQRCRKTFCRHHEIQNIRHLRLALRKFNYLKISERKNYSQNMFSPKIILRNLKRWPKEIARQKLFWLILRKTFVAMWLKKWKSSVFQSHFRRQLLNITSVRDLKYTGSAEVRLMLWSFVCVSSEQPFVYFPSIYRQRIIRNKIHFSWVSLFVLLCWVQRQNLKKFSSFSISSPFFSTNYFSTRPRLRQTIKPKQKGRKIFAT